jgi:teichuronic acid biosynthesis glycosyltransferase TuaC
VRVLFVTNMWPDERRPWYGTFIRTQAESLQRLGVDLDVMAITGYEGRHAYLDAARAMPARARGGFDLIHAHYGHSGAVARLQRSAPLVISYCGDDLLATPNEDGSTTLRSRIEAAVFRRLAHVAAATITKSAEMEARLPRSRRARNHVIPNGVNLDRFAPIPRAEARQRLEWPQDERIVLFAGDPAIPRKNYALAEAACAVAASAVPDLRLRVACGHPPSEMPVLMSAADALVLTSLTEGSPNVVKEAMAAALPVVSVPVGDVPERLAGVEGCVVAPPEPGALGAGLASVVRRDRAPAARAAVEPLSLENVGRRVLAVYDEVLAAG